MAVTISGNQGISGTINGVIGNVTGNVTGNFLGGTINASSVTTNSLAFPANGNITGLALPPAFNAYWPPVGVGNAQLVSGTANGVILPKNPDSMLCN
jgi:hypothetical protein